MERTPSIGIKTSIGSKETFRSVATGKSYSFGEFKVPAVSSLVKEGPAPFVAPAPKIVSAERFGEFKPQPEINLAKAKEPVLPQFEIPETKKVEDKQLEKPIVVDIPEKKNEEEKAVKTEQAEESVTQTVTPAVEDPKPIQPEETTKPVTTTAPVIEAVQEIKPEAVKIVEEDKQPKEEIKIETIDLPISLKTNDEPKEEKKVIVEQTSKDTVQIEEIKIKLKLLAEETPLIEPVVAKPIKLIKQDALREKVIENSRVGQKIVKAVAKKAVTTETKQEIKSKEKQTIFMAIKIAQDTKEKEDKKKRFAFVKDSQAMTARSIRAAIAATSLYAEKVFNTFGLYTGLQKFTLSGEELATSLANPTDDTISGLAKKVGAPDGSYAQMLTQIGKMPETESVDDALAFMNHAIKDNTAVDIEEEERARGKESVNEADVLRVLVDAFKQDLVA